MKTMYIDGVEYTEAPETSWCDGCAFQNAGGASCTTATMAGQIAFGKDCCDRQTIYIRAENAPKPGYAMAELLKARDAINAAIAALEAAQ